MDNFKNARSMNPNPPNLQSALDWLANVVVGRLNVHFGKSDQFADGALNYQDDDTWLPPFIRRHDPSPEEFAILMMALAPHLAPAFFDNLVSAHLPEGGDFPEFGGVKGANHRGILPTGETAQ